MEAYSVRDLSFRYPSSDNYALDDISLAINSGEFVTVCGLSGSGKSTLLRMLKSCLQPVGQMRGTITFEGTELDKTDRRTQTEKIGFLMQSPDSQLVTDKVWHELAFGLESLGLPNNIIRSRTAETASFFGIEKYYHSRTDELSGGQKQLLNLASVMVMRPSVLILDEPASRLDPVSADTFYSMLRKINSELGTTIILSEHSLERVLELSDRVVLLEEGRVTCCEPPREFCRKLCSSASPMYDALPSAAKVTSLLSDCASSPAINVQEGRSRLREYIKGRRLHDIPVTEHTVKGRISAVLKNVCMRYEKGSPDILKGVDMKLYKGEILAVIGGNGAGKSTLLSVIAGIHKPFMGTVKFTDKLKISGLPQEPRSLFVKNTVEDDLRDILKDSKKDSDKEALLNRTIDLCKLQHLLKRHPYDLSGGEQQRAALCKVLLTEPDILLLDEPEKGLDCTFRSRLASILRSLSRSGMTIVIVCHDLEFCAHTADRCVMLFDGTIVSEGTPKELFSQNGIYTTSYSRLTKGIIDRAVTEKDVLYALGITYPAKSDPTGKHGEPPHTDSKPPIDKHSDPSHTDPAILTDKHCDPSHTAPATPADKPDKSDKPSHNALANSNGKHKKTHGSKHRSSRSIPSEQNGTPKKKNGVLRKIALLVTSLIFLFFLLVTSETIKLPLSEELSPFMFIPLFISASAVIILIGSKGENADIMRTPFRPVSSLLSLISFLVVIPLTIFAGIVLFDNSKYLFISLLIMLEASAPFYISFEKRGIHARELALIACLCALCAAGRALFYMLPSFKPVTALVIIFAASLGEETGFIIGSASMLISNLFFGQGAWTPWQMFSMGIIGYLAGLLFHRGAVRYSRVSLAVFGFVSALVIYGGIMNPAALIMSGGTVTTEALVSVYLLGLPVDTVHAVSTAIFIIIAADPLISKLERIKRRTVFVKAY